MADYYRPAVHRSATITTALTFLLIIAGGLVTSRDAGLAVPDWPLSFGTLNPPRWYAIENVRTEHGHRLIAGIVALATIVTAVIVQRLESRTWVRRLAASAVALVLLQALLGGLRVLNLSVDLAMVHGCLGQIFFTVVLLLAAATSPRWQPLVEQAAPSRRFRIHAGFAVAAVFVQLLLGIALRHGGAPPASLLQTPMFYLHMFGAMIVGWLCLTLAAAAQDESGNAGGSSLVGPSRWLGYMVMAQVGLGLATLGTTHAMSFDRQATVAESWLPTLHVALGASILGLSGLLAAVAWLTPPSEPAPLTRGEPSTIGSS